MCEGLPLPRAMAFGWANIICIQLPIGLRLKVSHGRGRDQGSSVGGDFCCKEVFTSRAISVLCEHFRWSFGRKQLRFRLHVSGPSFTRQGICCPKPSKFLPRFILKCPLISTPPLASYKPTKAHTLFLKAEEILNILRGLHDCTGLEEDIKDLHAILSHSNPKSAQTRVDVDLWSLIGHASQGLAVTLSLVLGKNSGQNKDKFGVIVLSLPEIQTRLHRLLPSTGGLMLYHGEAGIGKSFTLQKAKFAIPKYVPTIKIVHYIMGSGGKLGLLSPFFHKLKNELGAAFPEISFVEASTEQELLCMVPILLQKAVVHFGLVLLILDGIDALSIFSEKNTRTTRLLSWLPLIPGLKVIVSCTTDSNAYLTICNLIEVKSMGSSFCRVAASGLSDSDRLEILRKYLTPERSF